MQKIDSIVIKKTTLFALSVIMVISTKSQDVIKLRSGDSLLVIVKEINLKEVVYKKLEFSIRNPDYKMPISSLSYIVYNNGTKEYFTNTNAVYPSDSMILSNRDYFSNGYNDAKINYKGYKSAATLTFVTSLYSPFIGLIPAIICSAKAPEYQSLSSNYNVLMSNSDYRDGYFQKAKKIKQQKVWKNWLIPTSIWTAALVGAIIIVNNSIP